MGRKSIKTSKKEKEKAEEMEVQEKEDKVECGRDKTQHVKQMY